MRIVLKEPSTALKEAHSFIESFAKQNQIPNSTAGDLDLALGELLSNILNYGYKKGEKELLIILECELKEEGGPDPASSKDKGKKRAIHGLLIDGGRGFDPTTHKSTSENPVSIETQPIGGMGLVIVKKILSSMAYERKDNKNHLHFSILL